MMSIVLAGLCLQLVLRCLPLKGLSLSHVAIATTCVDFIGKGIFVPDDCLTKPGENLLLNLYPASNVSVFVFFMVYNELQLVVLIGLSIEEVIEKSI